MDNFHIDILSQGRENLAVALGIAFGHAPGNKASHYSIGEANDKNAKRLIFYWADPGAHIKAHVLPFKMNAELATDFAHQWLERDEEPWGKQPDHDGDNGHGWRVYNEAWGHVDNSSYAFVAITRAWAMYGK